MERWVWDKLRECRDKMEDEWEKSERSAAQVGAERSFITVCVQDCKALWADLFLQIPEKTEVNYGCIPEKEYENLQRMCAKLRSQVRDQNTTAYTVMEILKGKIHRQQSTIDHIHKTLLQEVLILREELFRKQREHNEEEESGFKPDQFSLLDYVRFADNQLQDAANAMADAMRDQVTVTQKAYDMEVEKHRMGRRKSKAEQDLQQRLLKEQEERLEEVRQLRVEIETLKSQLTLKQAEGKSRLDAEVQRLTEIHQQEVSLLHTEAEEKLAKLMRQQGTTTTGPAPAVSPVTPSSPTANTLAAIGVPVDKIEIHRVADGARKELNATHDAYRLKIETMRLEWETELAEVEEKYVEEQRELLKANSDLYRALRAARGEVNELRMDKERLTLKIEQNAGAAAEIQKLEDKIRIMEKEEGDFHNILQKHMKEEGELRDKLAALQGQMKSMEEHVKELEERERESSVRRGTRGLVFSEENDDVIPPMAVMSPRRFIDLEASPTAASYRSRSIAESSLGSPRKRASNRPSVQVGRRPTVDRRRSRASASPSGSPRIEPGLPELARLEASEQEAEILKAEAELLQEELKALQEKCTGLEEAEAELKKRLQEATGWVDAVVITRRLTAEDGTGVLIGARGVIHRTEGETDWIQVEDGRKIIDPAEDGYEVLTPKEYIRLVELRIAQERVELNARTTKAESELDVAVEIKKTAQNMVEERDIELTELRAKLATAVPAAEFKELQVKCRDLEIEMMAEQGRLLTETDIFSEEREELATKVDDLQMELDTTRERLQETLRQLENLQKETAEAETWTGEDGMEGTEDKETQTETEESPELFLTTSEYSFRAASPRRPTVPKADVAMQTEPNVPRAQSKIRRRSSYPSPELHFYERERLGRFRSHRFSNYSDVLDLLDEDEFPEEDDEDRVSISSGLNIRRDRSRIQSHFSKRQSSVAGTVRREQSNPGSPGSAFGGSQHQQWPPALLGPDGVDSGEDADARTKRGSAATRTPRSHRSRSSSSPQQKRMSLALDRRQSGEGRKPQPTMTFTSVH
eukprot:Hpha_TRINITY_DN16880_c1_g3::TRINITY_DN16880_c1_g3_i1::g.148750::m.148750